MKIARYILFSLFVFVSFLFFIPPEALAVSVAISGYPATITQDPFTLTASVSGASNGTNYLRVDIYKEGTQNYFGETYNGTDWYSGSDYHLYLPITIAGSNWSGTLQGSLGSPTTTQYDGTGTYRVRLRRYTNGGSNTASEADASSVVVAISVPTPTPTPTLTPQPPSVTPTNAPTPSIKPSVTLSPSTTPTHTPTLFSQLEGGSESALTDDKEVLGQQTTPTDMPEEQFMAAHTTVVPWPAIILSGIGILLIGSCGILVFIKLKEKNESNI